MTTSEIIAWSALGLGAFNTIIGGILNASWFSEWMKDKLKKKKYTVYSHIKGQKEIDRSLRNISEETGAHVVTLWGFENGTYYTSGYPDLFTSCIAQYPSPGESLEISNSDSILMPDMTELFKRKRYTRFARIFAALDSTDVNEYYFDSDFKYNDFQSSLSEQYGLKSYYVFKIKDTRISNVEKQWVHTLIIGFNSKFEMSDSQHRFVLQEIETLKTNLLL